MININKVKCYCKDDISLIENYELAVNDPNEMWVCHHRDEVKILPSNIKVYRSKQDLLYNNRYYKCPANELIFLTKKEHYNIHKGYKKEHSIRKTRSEFGIKFEDKYGYHRSDNPKLYHKELVWYLAHNKQCSWEV